MFKALTVVAMFVGASSAAAQTCPEPTGWDVPEKRVAARASDFRFALKSGATHRLQLHPQSAVALPVKAPQATTRGRHAGLAALDIERAGRIDVLLSDRAYVDLVEGGKTLKSVDHGRVNCNGIYKRVSFDVRPGRHVVQITGSQAKSVRIATISR